MSPVSRDCVDGICRFSVASLFAVGSATGCVPTHVAAVALEDGGDEIGSGDADGSDGDGSDADGSDGDGDDVVACSLPDPMPMCDAFADPLRAPEFACYEGISAATFRSDDTSAWRRAQEFGNAFWVSESSAAVLVLSTGSLPEPNEAGQVVAEPSAAQLASTDNANPNAAMLPAPIDVNPGSQGGPYQNCDGIGDCSETLPARWREGGAANDLLWLRFEADVPSDARGYTVQVGFLSAEYPERVGEVANDTFVWWASDEGFAGNIATFDGMPATVTGLADVMAPHRLDDPMLLRTGFDGGTGVPCTVDGEELPSCPIGAATGWLELRGPATPGTRISIAVALFDQGDALLDTVVVLDDWRWTCDGCTPGEDCGLQLR